MSIFSSFRAKKKAPGETRGLLRSLIKTATGFVLHPWPPEMILLNYLWTGAIRQGTDATPLSETTQITSAVMVKERYSIFTLRLPFIRFLLTEIFYMNKFKKSSGN
jgi:hypothetical protein